MENTTLDTYLDSFIQIINEHTDETISKILLDHFIGFSKPFISEILNELQIDNTTYSY